MGNGNHTNWGYWIKEELYTPKFYIPTVSEAGILGKCKLLAADGKMKRQVVLFDNIEVGFIQLGFGFGESYLVKAVNSKTGEKLMCSKDEAILRLVEIYG